MQKTYRELLDAAGRAKTQKTVRGNHRLAAEAFNRDHWRDDVALVVERDGPGAGAQLLGPAETRDDGLAYVPILDARRLGWLPLAEASAVRESDTWVKGEIGRLRDELSSAQTVVPTDPGAEPDKPTRGRVAAESRAGDESLVEVEPIGAEDAATEIADGVRSRIGRDFDETHNARALGERIWSELYGHGAWLDLQESETGRGRPSRRDIEQAIDLLAAPLKRGETDEDAIRRAIDLLRSESEPGPVGKIEVSRALECAMGFELPDSLALAIEEELGDFVMFRERDLDRAGEKLHEAREEIRREGEEIAEELAGMREEWDAAVSRVTETLEREQIENDLDPSCLSSDAIFALVTVFAARRRELARALGRSSDTVWEDLVEAAGVARQVADNSDPWVENAATMLRCEPERDAVLDALRSLLDRTRILADADPTPTEAYRRDFVESAARWLGCEATEDAILDALRRCSDALLTDKGSMLGRIRDVVASQRSLARLQGVDATNVAAVELVEYLADQFNCEKTPAAVRVAYDDGKCSGPINWQATVARALGLPESAPWGEIVNRAGERATPSIGSIAATEAGRVAARMLECEPSPLAVKAALESRLYDPRGPVERPAPPPTRDPAAIEDLGDASEVLIEHARRLAALERLAISGLANEVEIVVTESEPGERDPLALVELDELRDLVRRIAELLGCDPTPEQARIAVEALHEGREQLERALVQIDLEAKALQAERDGARCQTELDRRTIEQANLEIEDLRAQGERERGRLRSELAEARAEAQSGVVLVQNAPSDAAALDRAASEIDRVRHVVLALADRAVGEACARMARGLAAHLEDQVEIGAIALGRRHVAGVES